MRRPLILVGSALLAVVSEAAVVQGTVAIPEGFEAEIDTTPSMWLIENGLVPIAPPLEDPRTRMVVVLEGGEAAAAAGPSATVTLRDMRLAPRVFPVTVGTAVDFKNEDRSVHALYSPGDSRFAAQPQAPGGLRTHRFDRAGAYEIRCKEVPHVRGVVLVLAGGLFALPQSGGGFRLENVPAGTYTLRVWYAGDFIHTQAVEVGAGDAPSAQIDVTLAARKAAKTP